MSQFLSMSDDDAKNLFDKINDQLAAYNATVYDALTFSIFFLTNVIMDTPEDKRLEILDDVLLATKGTVVTLTELQKLNIDPNKAPAEQVTETAKKVMSTDEFIKSAEKLVNTSKRLN